MREFSERFGYRPLRTSERMEEIRKMKAKQVAGFLKRIFRRTSPLGRQTTRRGIPCRTISKEESHTLRAEDRRAYFKRIETHKGARANVASPGGEVKF